MGNKVVDIHDSTKMVRLIDETEKRVGNMTGIELQGICRNLDIEWFDNMAEKVQQRDDTDMGGLMLLAIYTQVQANVQREFDADPTGESDTNEEGL